MPNKDSNYSPGIIDFIWFPKRLGHVTDEWSKQQMQITATVDFEGIRHGFAGNTVTTKQGLLGFSSFNLVQMKDKSIIKVLILSSM